MPVHVGGVLFDLDNTLADRDAAVLHWAHWFARDRIGGVDPGEIETAVATLVALDGEGRTPKDGMFQAIKERYAGIPGDVETLTAEFRDCLLNHLPPLAPGAVRLLAALDANRIPWGIVSNGSAAQFAKIRKLGLQDRAHCIVISEIAGARKPDQKIFQLAAEGLSVAAGDVLFVGDHPEADIMGAAMAGMRTAWLNRGRVWHAHCAPVVPDTIINTLAELLWAADGPPG